jgi:GTP-binding protein Era
MNALIGEKVSIVSNRPQTTRNKISGIMNGEDYQVVFLDTPGIHSPKNSLGSYMMKSVRSAVEGVDAIIYVADAGRELSDRDLDLIRKYISEGIGVIVAMNKTDEVTAEKIFSELDKLNAVDGIAAVVPLSALKGSNVEKVRTELLKLIPEGECFYPRDMITDKTERFMVAEILREKALRNLNEEVPHGVGVEVKKFRERSGSDVVDVDLDLVCEKQSHKGIIIGKQGSMLKKIVTQARQDMEKLLGVKVFLTVFVKVKEDWRDDNLILRQLGYDKKED